MTPEEEIEKILGRKLAPEENGSIPDLNTFPAHLLTEARAIARSSKLLAFLFVRFYSGSRQLGEVKRFIEEVVVGGQEPARWCREPLLCCSRVDGPQVLELSRNKVVTDLQGIPGERWVRLVPQRASWDYTGYCGAPAVLNRSANYRWQVPGGVSSLVLTGNEKIETVDDLTIAVRRWITSRVAWQLARKQIVLTPSVDVSQVARTLSRTTSPSLDAEIAIRSLLREERELGPWADAVPGFRGPDEWYTA
jgi:hypothetical protein